MEELELKGKEKRLYKKLYEKFNNQLADAISRKDVKKELQLLWTAVAVIENHNMDWKAAEVAHPEVTKLSQLYALIESHGPKFPRIKL
jgi:hypothetical protein